MECFKRWDICEYFNGLILFVDIFLFWFEIVECVFIGGIFLLKVDVLCFLLEKYGYRLIYSINFREIILVVLEKEKEKFWGEFEIVKEVSVIFDGIVRMGEVFVIVICFV